MPLKVICAAHSPLMAHVKAPPREAAMVDAAFAGLAAEVERYDPELVVVFGPDHFAGFLYDLMPPLCIGVRARAMGDFGISEAGMPFDVPEKLALSLVESVQAAGFDAALSYRMNIDHGFVQSIEQFAGGVGRYPTIPVFINCAAPPLPAMARVLAFGRAMGAFLSGLDKRVLVIGSGGLSHDPPIPRIGVAPPEVEELLIAGHDASPQRMAQKLERNTIVAMNLVRGEGTARPLNAAWDQWFMERLVADELDLLSQLDTSAITRDAGVGGQEVRTWLAAFGALSAAGPYRAEVRHYSAIPHWNAGFGIVSASPIGEPS